MSPEAMERLEKLAPRMANRSDGRKDTPACGPKLSDCVQLHVAVGSGPGGFNVYRCKHCGDEEWL